VSAVSAFRDVDTPCAGTGVSSKAIRPIVLFALGVPSDITAQAIADGLRFAHRRAVLSIGIELNSLVQRQAIAGRRPSRLLGAEQEGYS
jgi:hypothetical protein